MSQSPKWRVSDELWERVEPLLPRYRRHRGGGRPRVDRRRVLDGILYVLRTGCQWKAAPAEFGSPSTLHRYFQEWVRKGVFFRLWKEALREYDELAGIDWGWQSLDGAMTKAPLGGEKVGPNPTDRGKCGTKRSLLTDGDDVPLAVAIAGANVHDKKLVELTLQSFAVRRPRPQPDGRKQHFCGDKGYDYPDIRRLLRRWAYVLHIKSRGEEAQETPIQPSQTSAPLGGRAQSLVDQSLSAPADPVGEEGGQLRGDASLCLRHHYVERVPRFGIGS